MKPLYLILTIVISIAVIFGVYSLITANKTIEMDEQINEEAQVISTGDFMANAHEVQGKAFVIEGNILRFEDFETINGPNLHIYLASDLNANDYIDLGEIRATKGNVNYEIPEGTDLEKYDKVLVWCVPFRVLFSHAELN